ncbi:hypothetical protein U1Q18_002496 [Sarracenia purpurea var. burkii]
MGMVRLIAGGLEEREEEGGVEAGENSVSYGKDTVDCVGTYWRTPICESSPLVRESSLTGRESSLPGGESSLAIQESSLPVRKSSLGVRESSLAIEESSLAIRESSPPRTESEEGLRSENLREKGWTKESI